MAHKVLFLEHNVDGTVGGSHFCLLEICRHLDRDHYEPLVWFFQDNSLLQEFSASGAAVIVERPPLPLLLDGGRESLLRRMRGIVQSSINVARTLVINRRWWKERLRRHEVKLVHLNNTALADIDLQLACSELGIPCIAHQRGFPPPAQWITMAIARRLRSIVAISSLVRSDLLDRGFPDSSIKLIYDGIDPVRIETISPASSDELALHGISSGNPLVGIVGNVKRWKGQEIALKAVAALRGEFPELKCLVVGAIPDQRYFEQLTEFCKQNQLEGMVRFTGYHPRPPALMAHMDVVLHASIQPEPFGIVLLEAMALGKPVVAARAGGPTDIVVDGETGYLFASGNPVEMAASIRRVLIDSTKGRNMGLAGRKRMNDLFTAAANVGSLQTLYAGILANAGSAT